MNPRSASIVAGAFLLAVTEGAAFAADPTTADCLAASDASLKAASRHKLRAQRSQLLVCAAESCPADIRKECGSRVEAVNTQIPTVIFQAKDASGSDVGAVRVTMDGELLAERLEGIALSVDPGEHSFTFEMAGQPPVTKTFLILQTQKDRREVIALGAPLPASTPVVSSPAVAPSPPPVSEPSHGDGLGTQRTLALVAGGIGIVGLGIGAAFGALALSDKSDAENACPNGQCPTAAAANKWSTAGSAGNVSTIAFVAGGVGLAGAAVLWFTAPASSAAASARVGLGLGSVQVVGSW